MPAGGGNVTGAAGEFRGESPAGVCILSLPHLAAPSEAFFGRRGLAAGLGRVFLRWPKMPGKTHFAAKAEPFEVSLVECGNFLYIL